MAQSAPRSPSKGEIMGSIPIGANPLFMLSLLAPAGVLLVRYNAFILPPLLIFGVTFFFHLTIPIRGLPTIHAEIIY